MSENIGNVIQIAGPAVDVQFTEAAMPPIYQALKVVSDGFTVPSPINVILDCLLYTSQLPVPSTQRWRNWVLGTGNWQLLSLIHI